MKKLILTTLTVVCSLGVFAQGTVVFNNRVSGSVITHVYLGGDWQVIGNSVDWSGYTALVNDATHVYMAQLLGVTGADQPEHSLGLSTPVTTFRTTTAAAGLVNAVTATMDDVAPDAAVASIEMVAWDNSSGLYPTWAQAKVAWQQRLIAAGEGGIFNLGPIGGILNQPPNLTGLQSFNIWLMPEPAPFALLGLCGAVLLIARRFKRGR